MTAEGVDAAPRPGALDLYRAAFVTTRALADRPLVRPAIELGFIVAWIFLRVTGDHPRLDVGWTLAAVVVTVVSPGSGLVILAGVAPWDEPLSLGRTLGLRHLLVLALGLSVALRVVVRPTSMPRSLPVAIAGGLLAITLVLGVGSMYAQYGRAIGWDSATLWLAGFGAAMIVVLAAAWLGYSGHRRALWAAVIAATLAGLLSLAAHLVPVFVRGLPLDALLADKTFGTRLSGAIASPNAMVSLIVNPTAVYAAALVHASDRRLRVASAMLLVPLVVALALTYSRAAIIGLFAIAVIVLWRWRRPVAIVLLVVGIAVGIALAPTYLQARGNVLGGSAAVVPGKVLIATDEQRITAWVAASRMFVDDPLIGHGFRSYKQLAPDYGDQVLGSPHNEWIRLFAEEGIVGGLLGLAFVFAVARGLARAPGWLAIGSLGAFVAWAITATFNNPFLFLQVNVIAFTIAGVMLGVGQRAEEVAPVTQTEAMTAASAEARS